MFASSLSLDASHLAIRQLHRTEDRFASAKVSIASKFTYILRGWVGKRFAYFIEHKAEELAEKALFFKGASVDLQSELAQEQADPGELITAIDGFLPMVVDGMQRCKEFGPLLRKRNPQSRAAGALDKLVQALEALHESVSLLRVVATGGSLPGFLFAYQGVETWEAAINHQREQFSKVRASIRGGDTSDIDAELLHLAEQAMRASEERDLTQDPDWARRLSDRTFH
jgi:hypothetical protein